MSGRSVLKKSLPEIQTDKFDPVEGAMLSFSTCVNDIFGYATYNVSSAIAPLKHHHCEVIQS